MSRLQDLELLKHIDEALEKTLRHTKGKSSFQLASITWNSIRKEKHF